MDIETQKLMETLKCDQKIALEEDFSNLRQKASDEVKAKIFVSNLPDELKQPLSDFVKAKLMSEKSI